MCIRDRFGRLTKSELVRVVTKILYYALPNISNFKRIGSQNVIESAAYFQPVDLAGVLWSTVYLLLYTAILLTMAITIFSRRDFK